MAKEKSSLDPKAIEVINKQYAKTSAEAKKQAVATSELKKLSDEIKDSWGDLADVLLKVNSYSSKLGNNFSDVEDLSKKLISNIESVGTELYEQLEVGKKIKDIQKEQSKRLSEIKEANKGLVDLAQKQQKLDEQRNSLSETKYKNLQKELDAEKQVKEAALEKLQTERQIARTELRALRVLKDAADAMDKANKHAKDLRFNIENATNTVTNKLSKSFEFIEEVPFLSDVIGLDSIKEELEKNVKDSLVRSMVAGKGAASSMFTAMVSGARSLIATMAPLLPLILAAYAVYKAFEFDKELTQFSKDLDVSKDSAMELSMEADHLATHLGMANITGKEMQASMVALRNEFGAIAMTADEGLVESVTLLRERMGLTNEEAIGLSKTATLLGTDLDTLAASSMTMAEGLMSGKEMLQEMSKIPSDILVSFKGTTKELQKAVVKGKLFGLTLEKTAKAGEALLDFESSIEAEMKFNVLSGKQMNLNEARRLALVGDTAGLQKELLRQAKSLEEYQSMSPMAQKAMAEALGMTKEEMADMLTKAEQLKNTGLEEKEINDLLNANAEAQNAAMAKMNDKGKEYLKSLIEKRNQEEATAKIQASMNRLMEAFSKSLLPVVDLLGEILGYIGNVVDYITMGVEKINHFAHSLSGSNEELKEGEGIMSKILNWTIGISTAMLAWKVGKKMLGGLKSMIPGMGGGKATDALSGAGGGNVDAMSGQADKAKSLADKFKGIADSVKSFFDIIRNAVKGIMGIITDVFTGVGEALSGFFKSFSSISFTDLIKGALALGIMAGSLWLMGEALGKFVDIGLDDLGIAALALIGLTAAVVGLSYILPMIAMGSIALGIMSAALWVFGEAAGSVADSMPALASGFKLFGDIDGGNLIGVAAGIAALSIALAGYGAGSALSGIGSAIGALFDEDPVEKFNRFAAIDANKLLTVAGAITALGSALNAFSNSIASIGDVSAFTDAVEEIADSDIAAAAPALAAISAAGAGGGTQPAAAGAQQGSLNEVAGLLKELIAKVDQPVQIKFGTRVIDEIDKQATLRRGYATKIDNTYGRI